MQVSPFCIPTCFSFTEEEEMDGMSKIIRNNRWRKQQKKTKSMAWIKEETSMECIK